MNEPQLQPIWPPAQALHHEFKKFMAEREKVRQGLPLMNQIPADQLVQILLLDVAQSGRFIGKILKLLEDQERKARDEKRGEGEQAKSV